VVRGVGPPVPRRLPQLDGARSPTSVTNWVADSGATNHTTPHPGHISSPMPPLVAHPPSNIVGNDSVLPVSSVGDSVLPGPFLPQRCPAIALDLVKSLLSVRCFTTDKSCSMEFEPFGLSMKDLATRRMLARYDSPGPLYTLHLPTLRDVPYALVAAASSTT
jgi:hypothetical protein